MQGAQLRRTGATLRRWKSSTGSTFAVDAPGPAVRAHQFTVSLSVSLCLQFHFFFEFYDAFALLVR
jgi:hypothetical protein